MAGVCRRPTCPGYGTDLICTEPGHWHEDRGSQEGGYSASVPNTTAHYATSIGVELGHAVRHVQAARAATTAQARTFNFDHADHHLTAATDHVEKLLGHLDAHYPAESAELKRLRDATPRAPD